jgi:hypothetical protein
MSITPEALAKIDREHPIKVIRKMLIVGLSSYSEVERLRSLYDNLESCGRTPEGMSVPILQGDFLAGDFADALAFLEQLADEVPA